MDASFIPVKRGSDPVTIFSEPHFKAEIEATDPNTIMYVPGSECNLSSGMEKYLYDGFNIYGLYSYSSASEGYIDVDVSFPESGDYRIWVRTVKHIRQPGQGKPAFEFFIDDVAKEGMVVEAPAYHWNWIDCGKYTLSSGSHNLKLTFDSRDSWFESFIIKKVTTLSTESRRNATKIEAQSADYTKNTIAELNTGKLVASFKEDYFNPDNEYSKMVFDFMDSVTFYVGAKKREVVPDFGGYVLGYKISDDLSSITMEFVDRIADFYRSPVFKNFKVGYGSTGLDQAVNAHRYNFSNLMQFIEYMASSIEFPMLYKHKISYAFMLNMGDVNDFNSISCSGALKKQDPNTGFPAPGLMLYYPNVSFGQCSENSSLPVEVVLYSNTSRPVDATEFQYLVFDYMGSGLSTAYPFKFNIVLTMYRFDENPEDAKDYTITFNSGRVEGNIIGHVEPQLNGFPASFKFNVKEAFDNASTSEGYYVTKLRLVDDLDLVTSMNLRDRVIWMDNIGMMAPEANLQTELNMDYNYPIEIVRKVAEEVGYTAYVEYGNERRYDKFVFEKISGNPGLVEAKQGVNVLDVNNYQYKASISNNGFANSAFRHYHPQEGSNKITKGTGYTNMDSFLRYGTWKNYKDLTDVSNHVDATKDATDYVNSHCYQQIGFSLEILGTTLLTPANYLVTDLPQKFLKGNHEIKSMSNSLNLESQKFVTKIDLNIPSNRFKASIQEIKRKLLGMDSIRTQGLVLGDQGVSLGFSSPGSFIQRRA